MCEEIYEGIGKDSHTEIKVLKSEKYDEIVLLKDIPFYSMCEHHLLPFSGVAHVAYIPQGTGSPASASWRGLLNWRPSGYKSRSGSPRISRNPS